MIIACTVSYNSSEIIENTIDALLRQTYPVDRIVIVDNCSTDENKKRLSLYRNKSPKIDIVWLNSNGGGATGFYEAMKYAREQYNPEWYWLMDDDAYPEDDCLRILMDRQEKLDNVGFIAPIIWGLDNKKHQLYHARKSTSKPYRFERVADSYEKLNPVEQIDVDAFVGPLISNVAVKACGFPRPGYFLEGDDTDYTFRITRKYKGYLVKDAQINHKDLVITDGINPGMWWKQYYSFRNPILFAKYSFSGIKRIRAICSHLGFANKQILKMYLDSRYRGYRIFRSRILLKGLIDGIRKKEGIVIKPEEYKESLLNLEAKMKGKG